MPATEAVPKITKARKRKSKEPTGGDPDQDDDERENGETPGPNEGRRGTKRRTADGTTAADGTAADAQTTAATVNPAMGAPPHAPPHGLNVTEGFAKRDTTSMGLTVDAAYFDNKPVRGLHCTCGASRGVRAGGCGGLGVSIASLYSCARCV